MEKINIAELLKDCPSGMELDCVMYENIVLDSVDEDEYYPISIKCIQDGDIITLTKYGCLTHNKSGKCVIFPKGKTTWEGFQRPFQNGDIITDSLGTCIFRGEGRIKGTVDYYCGISSGCLSVRENKLRPDGHYGFIVDYRLATEKEKAKFFKIIKENGYKWNAVTKTLEELPKFKVGDRIKHIVGREEIATVVSVEESHYNLDSKVGTSAFSISLQREWELVPNKFDITTLKPFDKVLARDNEKHIWRAEFYSHYDNNEHYKYICVGTIYKQCIPYNEETANLVNTTNDCDEYYKTWEK